MPSDVIPVDDNYFYGVCFIQDAYKSVIKEIQMGKSEKQTIYVRELKKGGYTEWKKIVCEKDINPKFVKRLSYALHSKRSVRRTRIS